jgi:hypothetical protein
MRNPASTVTDRQKPVWIRAEDLNSNSYITHKFLLMHKLLLINLSNVIVAFILVRLLYVKYHVRGLRSMSL